MSDFTAADYAAILDPEHKMGSLWWKTGCPKCGSYWPKNCTCGTYSGSPCEPIWTFIGPDNLLTARSESWRGEEWLRSKGCRIYLHSDGTTKVFGGSRGSQMSGLTEHGFNIIEHWDHVTAISEAVRKAYNESKRTDRES